MPWVLFAKAQDAQHSGDAVGAIRALNQVLETPGLESRQYLQAWHFLRALGQQPAAAEAKRVFGVVLEVALDGGLDLLAAYEDNSARYFNYSGAAVVWEGGTDLENSPIQALLAAARPVAVAIGPWEEARLPAPAAGLARINILTPSGLHFGQAPFATLFQDPMGGPVLLRGQELMQALMDLAPPDAGSTSAS
ncbi:hypothetical protein IC235_03765 [Hymenobacter sp. BT664]|uniref:Uncharacterized protein n=1 Tax=Hymenobacter montanus TaxID=2771359 RepID=A0A927BBB1_9BACT|nr:hypothetical protein [Hymenobacter montanus]MBD2767009.1 hypothetical protein [Hymenobacter montanus]